MVIIVCAILLGFGGVLASAALKTGYGIYFFVLFGVGFVFFSWALARVTRVSVFRRVMAAIGLSMAVVTLCLLGFGY